MAAVRLAIFDYGLLEMRVREKKGLHASACDAVREALRLLGLTITYRAVEEVWLEQRADPKVRLFTRDEMADDELALMAVALKCIATMETTAFRSILLKTWEELKERRPRRR